MGTVCNSLFKIFDKLEIFNNQSGVVTKTKDNIILTNNLMTHKYLKGYQNIFFY